MIVRRRKIVVFLLLTVLVLLPLKAAEGFNFYKRAFQWPPKFCFPKSCQSHGFCFANKCQSSIPDNTLIIHGCWPTNESPLIIPEPETCDIDWTSQKLQDNLTYSLTSQSCREAMRSKWPQLLRSQTNMDFWLQEWNRHGKVSELTPVNYFQAKL
ncbi:Ribonuclease 3 [Linum perenne]